MARGSDKPDKPDKLGTTEVMRQALLDFVARLADNKYALGRHYAEWCSSAPTLESGVAAAAMAQDELGHARAIYPLLRDLAPAGVDLAQIDPDTRTQRQHVAVLDQPFAGWEDFVAANFLLDTAMTTIFHAAVASSFEPLAGRSRKVLQEERVHQQHGEAWVRRLARGTSAVRNALDASLNRFWGETLCWFGPPETTGVLAQQHILDASPDTLRARFLRSIGPTVAAAGVDLPVRRSAADAWELSQPLPWQAWDAATYRLKPDAATGARTGRRGASQ